LGSGKQWFSWIHEEDLANVFLFLLEHKELDGPINCTSPNPVRNREFTEILGHVLQKPTLMPAVPGFALRLKMGEVGNVLLKGQRVQPRRLLESGFRFQFANVREALEDILRQ
jgi:NAD dependent epimerase/dehydratase family enzyme